MKLYLSVLIVFSFFLNSVSAMQDQFQLESKNDLKFVNSVLSVEDALDQKNLPIKFIFDEDNDDLMHPFKTYTISLVMTLKSKSTAIITDGNILKLFMEFRLNKKSPSELNQVETFISCLCNDFPFNAREFKCYHITNSRFFLIIPEDMYNQYKKSFNFDKLSERGIFLDDTSDINIILNGYKDNKPYDLSILQAIFDTQNVANVIWSVVLEGHGGRVHHFDDLTRTSIGTSGLKISSLNNFLRFFNTKVNTNIVYIVTCFLGGEGKFYIEDLSTLDYYLIITGIRDDETWLPMELEKFNIDFFKKAQLVDKNNPKSMQGLINLITYFEQTPSSRHGIANYPYIKKPLKSYFEIPMRENVQILSYDEIKKETCIKDTNLLVINRSSKKSSSQQKLIIHPCKFPLDEFEYSNLSKKAIKLFNDIPSSANYIVSGKDIKENFARNSSLNAEGCSSIQLLLKKETNSEYMYPQIIMPIEKNMEKFEYCNKRIHKVNLDFNIEVKSEKGNDVGGILSFFKDAFSDYNKSDRLISIDINRITGFNDISALFEYCHRVKKIVSKNELFSNLYKLLNKATENNVLSLKNVEILIRNSVDKYHNRMFVAFDFNSEDKWVIELGGKNLLAVHKSSIKECLKNYILKEHADAKKAADVIMAKARVLSC